eukprot:CAMPEP_0181294862 /NCGR_PEP_ID=MMETSP1101-20121128/3833_1 /TAXON_ID=46948 /ORGANISM="Rhodomonas abbreviata, Strain Caron Lab Isolate" /LENGTH=139 /DNA_ID=CAMNT_0023399561 /DNA_START=47 /DNA_END=466 /DNA_ORIENTATION=+
MKTAALFLAFVAALAIVNAEEATECTQDDLDWAEECIGNVRVNFYENLKLQKVEPALAGCLETQPMVMCIAASCCEDEDMQEEVSKIKKFWADHMDTEGISADYVCELECGVDYNSGLNLQASVSFVFAALVATLYTSY